MIYLTRRYRFSASHRLHQDALTAEENRRLYGKCDNPYGHGHNYVLEVTVGGAIEPATGMVFDLAVLDRTVAQEVLEPYDYSYLNLDVENFRALVPTTENLCVEIFRLLEEKLRGQGRWSRARLERVRLEETSSNFFEYAGGREDPPCARSVP
jgi:6-pyruvoyltetrahydropterin/6-carboxytetrahydropterin synthase